MIRRRSLLGLVVVKPVERRRQNHMGLREQRIVSTTTHSRPAFSSAGEIFLFNLCSTTAR